MQVQFADTVLNIAITGPLVRIDLGVVAPHTGSDGKQALRASPTQQVVMPIEGFVRAFGMQEQVIKKLIADGVIKPKAVKAAQAGAPDMAEEAAAAPTPAPAPDKGGKASRGKR